jgi:hypothetical protein
MAPISAPVVLSVWEQSRGSHPVDQALALLALAEPGASADQLASLSLGERDARLMALREQIFGPRLDALADCPSCAEQLEFGLSTSELRAQPEAPAPQALEIEAGDRRLRFRPINSYDVAAITRCQDAREARQLLAERSLVEPMEEELPPDTVDQLAARLAECDRQAEILLDLTCPTCGHAWQITFDICSFMWTEVSAEAQHLLHEVDMLARVYGWREADILAMSPARRNLYMEMAGS